jgi:predicted ATPase/DNA-binding SARP family transcriptional activator/Tfp pilus assembly protein PilF
VTPTLRIRLLGEFQIEYDGAPLAGLSSARLQSLLAYLLLHRDAPQARAHAAFRIWPDTSEAQAQANLRYFLHQLRRVLPDADRYIQSDKVTLQWRADAPCALDVADFEQALAEAGSATSAGPHALEQALAHYTGDLLPSCYDDWIVPERERLRNLLQEALERLSILWEQRGSYAAAITCSQRLLRHDPLREATYRQLMRLHALNGDPVDVSRVYQTCVAVLQRELAVEPSAATRAEYERLVRAAAHPAPAAPAVLARRQAAAEHAPARLPVPLTSFIGRERELNQLKQLLQTTRLLTLTGAGGCGKTRLALAAADALLAAHSFADGVYWVELAALTDAALVPKAIASALGVAEESGRPLSETLSEAMRPRHVLIVLDNCEHLIETCAQVCRMLLSSAQRVHILATSREALNLAGETTWTVPLLTLPALEARAEPQSDLRGAERAESVQLFVERASSALPTFRLTQRNAGAVSNICTRLDGIPLAIELAAGRVKVLSVEQIASRLDDRFILLSAGHRDALPRHQSLRAAIDWSYQLLSPQERVLLHRLAVFAGGCTLEAAEAVCAYDGQLDVLNGLALLVDKSLLEQTRADGEPRFRMLETIRDFARARLLESEEAAPLFRAHAQYYRLLALKAEPHFFGAELEVWLTRLEKERDNIRAALEWGKISAERNPASAAQALEIGLHLAALLWRFWELRGYSAEGRVWLDALLARSGSLHTYERAYALHTAGNLASSQGDTPRAKELYQACLILSKELGNKQFIAHMNNNLGNIAFNEGNYDQAASLYAEALTHYREVGWTWGVSLEFRQLGVIARAQGQYERASSLYEESLAMYRQAGDKERIGLVLNSLGLLADDLAHYDEATRLFQEALTLYEQIGDQMGMPRARNNLGKMAQRQGDLSRAQALYEQSLAQAQGTGDKSSMAVALYGLGDIAMLRGEPEHALRPYRESLSLYRSIGYKRGVLECLEGFAKVDALFQPDEQAARLFGAGDALRQALHLPIPPSERAAHAESIARLRGALGEGIFAAAWAEGQALSLDQAVVAALAALKSVGAETHGT